MIAALCPVRNEGWVLGLTLRALLMWVDMVVILDHASTDSTAGIIAEVNNENPSRLALIHETDPTWEEMRHRQRILEMARKLGASHIVMVDADEILTGPIGEMRELVNMLPRNVLLQMNWICLDKIERTQNFRQAAERLAAGFPYMMPDDVEWQSTYYSSGMWADQRASVAFRDFPDCHWTARNGYDFHHREPMGPTWKPMWTRGKGGLMHLQFVNKRRLKAKQYLYQLTERLRWPDREPVSVVRDRYAATVEAALSAETKPVPATWWEPYAHLMQHLETHENATPWQETECRKILREHPGSSEGLDDFGLFS